MGDRAGSIPVIRMLELMDEIRGFLFYSVTVRGRHNLCGCMNACIHMHLYRLCRTAKQSPSIHRACSVLQSKTR